MYVDESNWTPSERALVTRMRAALVEVTPEGWNTVLRVADAQDPHRGELATTVIITFQAPQSSAAADKTVARTIWYDEVAEDGDVLQLASELWRDTA